LSDFVVRNIKKGVRKKVKKSALKFIWWSVLGFVVLPSMIGVFIYSIVQEVQEVNVYCFSLYNLILSSIVLFVLIISFGAFVPLWIKNYKKYKKNPDSFE